MRIINTIHVSYLMRDFLKYLLFSFLTGSSCFATFKLSPGEVYFDRPGTLYCVDDGLGLGSELNGGRSFSGIKGWKNLNDSIVWFFDVESSTQFNVKMLFDGNHQAQNTVISLTVSLNHEFKSKKNITLDSASIANGFLDFGSFSLSNSGLVSLRFNVEVSNGNEVGIIKSVELSGSNLSNYSLRQVRWRPAAAHARFENSESPSGIRLAVLQFESVTPNFSSYSPITTPFGYFGSVWQTSWMGQAKWTDPNFSLWSFGRDAEEPPLRTVAFIKCWRKLIL